MEGNRPIVVSIAGVDPSAGAGLLADIKTFEQHKVYGLGISTAQTVQTDTAFFSLRWERKEDILYIIEKMSQQYKVRAVKIGIVKDAKVLHAIVSFIHSISSSIKIVVDPVIRSSTEFDFWQEEVEENILISTLKKIELLTPNYNEALQLVAAADATKAAQLLSGYCNVLLKGGHNDAEPGVDHLYTKDSVLKLPPTIDPVFPKHGSGCVLSSAITANIALGHNVETACRSAKIYTEKFLSGNPSLLGYHVS